MNEWGAMNIRDLQYLVAVADLKNFSKAADLCHVSQPTLSNQIKKLEDTLGMAVFERSNKHVMLTEHGAGVVAHARRILSEVDKIKDLAEHAHDPLAGKFRLGAFPTLATYVFPKLVTQVKRTMPNVKLILMEEKTAALLEKLKLGTIDAALIALPVADDYLHAEPLFNDAFYLAVPPNHALAKAKSVTQGELAKHRLLLLEEGHCLRAQALEVCDLAGVSEEQDVRATGLETLRQMVKAGTGITFMPEIAISKNESGIVYVPFAKPQPRRTIALVWRKTSARLPAMQQFTAILKQLYA